MEKAPGTNSGLEALDERLGRAFDVEYKPFRRSLGMEEVRKLRQACSMAFSAEIHSQVIEKLIHYCLYVERRMEGRAAGNIEDIVIRYLVRYFGSLLAQGHSNPRHLEIGVLFGATTVLTWHAARLAEKDVTVSVIDPFEGYYGMDLDIVTKQKVDEATFRVNLGRFGVPQDKVEVFKGFSSNEAIVDACREFEVLSLLIDGDHSYEGVKKDWNNYGRLVVPGGYVLFDDYNSFQWPEVTEFINREVLSNLMDRWEIAMFYGSSLVLRRTSTPWDDPAGRADRLHSELGQKKWELDEADKEAARLKTELTLARERLKLLEEFKSIPITDLKKKYLAYRKLN